MLTFREAGEQLFHIVVDAAAVAYTGHQADQPDQQSRNGNNGSVCLVRPGPNAVRSTHGSNGCLKRGSAGDHKPKRTRRTIFSILGLTACADGFYQEVGRHEHQLEALPSFR